MTFKEEMKAYKARWAAVEGIIARERRFASIELRWQQLNTAYRMGKALGLPRGDPSEMDVIKRWARIKEKSAGQPLKA